MSTAAVEAASDDRLTIAVLSDIHAYASARDDEPSHLHTAMPEDDPTAHPIVGLEQLVEERGLSADIVLCPGDLGDRADADGIDFAWKLLQRVVAKLGTDRLVATAGNHDLDSRYIKNKWNPREVLQRLRPLFPVDDQAKCDQYWSRNFTIVEGPNCRIVTLNSCGYHGMGEEEKDHGRVSDHTLAEVAQELKAAEPSEVNLLLCHHHPVQFTDIGDDDYDVMEGGPALLELLRSGEVGRWMIIHGHRHVPHLTYALGGAASPIIFSAASLTVDLQRAAQARARNQFYILEFPLTATRDLGLPLAGRFRSWYWVPRSGWDDTPSDVALPADGGFGYREDGRTVAQTIRAHMADRGRARMTWDELLEEFPRMAYMTPDDLGLTRFELEQLGAGLVPARGAYGIEQVAF